MRKLTLGILIFGGAIVASLPFRRASIPDHPDEALVTGPATTWSIDPVEVMPPASLTAVESSGRKLAGSSVDLTAEPPMAIATRRQARTRRDITLPLTFDDLAVPESTPHFRGERFEALAGGPLAGGPLAGGPLAGGSSPGGPSPGVLSTGVSSADWAFADEALARGSLADEKAMSDSSVTGDDPRLASGLAQPKITEVGYRGDDRPSVPATSASNSIPNPSLENSPRQRHWIRQPR